MTERALDISFRILGALISDPKPEYHINISDLESNEIEAIRDYFSIHEILITEKEMIIKVKRVI